MAVDRHSGLFFFTEQIAQRHGRERYPVAVQAVLKLRNIIIRQPNQCRQKSQGGIKILHLLFDNGEIEDWLIVCQEFSLAVKNQTSRRGHILRVKPVAIRPGREVLILYNLKVKQFDNQRAEQKRDDHCSNSQPPGKKLLLSFVVF